MIYLVICSTIWFFLILYFDLAADLEKWQNNVPIEHDEEALYRMIVLTPSFIMLSLAAFTLPGMIWTVLLMFFWYWTLFDGLYNSFRSYEWFFTGTTDSDDAFTDQIAKWLGPIFHPIVKIIGVLGSTTLYILELKK